MTLKPFTSKEDPRMHRLWNPETRRYLHLSGRGETDDVTWSWLGFHYQSEALRDRALLLGDDWPYVRRARSAHREQTNDEQWA